MASVQANIRQLVPVLELEVFVGTVLLHTCPCWWQHLDYGEDRAASCVIIDFCRPLYLWLVII